MNPMKVKSMDDLPELPFEQILSHLNVMDRLNARNVSQSWRKKFDSYPWKSLCFSRCPSGFIFGKSRLAGGAFAQNFIATARTKSILTDFTKSVLSLHLKHLRLYDLSMFVESGAEFTKIFDSFTQLEALDLIRVRLQSWQSLKADLNLPMLNSIRLEELERTEALTLNTPKLKKVTLFDSPKLGVDYVEVNFVHGESVERLDTDTMGHLDVKKLKKLKSLYVSGGRIEIDLTFLVSLKELEEVHLEHLHHQAAEKLFEQMLLSGRTDLKIFVFGWLVNGPDDDLTAPRIQPYSEENRSRLANEIPFCSALYYHQIESVAPEWQMNILNRFVNLNKFIVSQPVQDINRFLAILKNFRHIADLKFCAHPQDLFDRLPEHCAVQKLIISAEVSDYAFLFRLKHLIHLDVSHPYCSIDLESIRKVLEELPFLLHFEFIYYKPTRGITCFAIEIDRPKFEVAARLSIYGKKIVTDVDSVIELITNGFR